MPDDPAVETVPEPPATPPEPPAAEPASQTEAAQGEQGEGAQAPDLAESIQALRADMQGLASRVAPEAEPPSFLDQLLGPEDEPQPAPQGQAPQPIPQGEPTGDDLLAAEIDKLVTERAQALIDEKVMPIFQGQEAERRESALLALPEKYPELKDPAVVQRVHDAMQADVRQYGPGILTDARQVERAFLQVKSLEAPAAAGDQATAEAVDRTNDGAVLEAGAGPGAPSSEPNPVEQEYLAAMGTHTGEKDVFTR